MVLDNTRRKNVMVFRFLTIHNSSINNFKTPTSIKVFESESPIRV